MVDRTELLLLDKEFQQIRVRIHDKRAKIEIMPEEFAKLIANDSKMIHLNDIIVV